MRQIDNMTPQEIDTLALKGMTAPRTAGERNKAQTLTQNYKGLIPAAEKTGEVRSDHTFDVENDTNTIESEPQGNKAQHSPESTPQPWTTEQTSDHGASVRIMDEQEVTIALCYQQPYDTWTAEANAAQIVRAVNHADKLAEALRLAVNVTTNKTLKAKLGEALAAYEESKQ